MTKWVQRGGRPRSASAGLARFSDERPLGSSRLRPPSSTGASTEPREHASPPSRRGLVLLLECNKQKLPPDSIPSDRRPWCVVHGTDAEFHRRCFLHRGTTPVPDPHRRVMFLVQQPNDDPAFDTSSSSHPRHMYSPRTRVRTRLARVNSGPPSRWFARNKCHVQKRAMGHISPPPTQHASSS